jgi:hypothetical protein
LHRLNQTAATDRGAHFWWGVHLRLEEDANGAHEKHWWGSKEQRFKIYMRALLAQLARHKKAKEQEQEEEHKHQHQQWGAGDDDEGGGGGSAGRQGSMAGAGLGAGGRVESVLRILYVASGIFDYIGDDTAGVGGVEKAESGGEHAGGQAGEAGEAREAGVEKEQEQEQERGRSIQRGQGSSAVGADYYTKAIEEATGLVVVHKVGQRLQVQLARVLV